MSEIGTFVPIEMFRVHSTAAPVRYGGRRAPTSLVFSTRLLVELSFAAHRVRTARGGATLDDSVAVGLTDDLIPVSIYHKNSAGPSIQ